MKRYVYIFVKTKKEIGVSTKTVIKQVANNGRSKKEAWQYMELGGAHGILLWLLRGEGALTSVHSKVTASVGDCLDQGCIFRR